MGYNYHLAKLSKTKYEKIKSYSMEQLHKMVKDEDCVYMGDVVNEFYDLGSDLDLKPLKPFLKPVFTNKKTHYEMSTGENQFSILTQEGFAKLIDMYHDLVAKHCQETEKKVAKLISGNLDAWETQKLQNELESKTKEWTDKSKMNYRPYNLKDPETLVGSWKYEYAIFQLVYMYKTFDFKKNVLFLTGH